MSLYLYMDVQLPLKYISNNFYLFLHIENWYVLPLVIAHLEILVFMLFAFSFTCYDSSNRDCKNFLIGNSNGTY